MSEVNKVVKYVLLDDEGKKHRKKLITLHPLNTEVDKLQVSGTEVESGEANVDYINAKTVKNIGGPAILSKSINENTGADYKNLVEEIYGGDSPAPTPVPPEPEENPNTPEQDEQEQLAQEAFAGGEKTYTVPEGKSINNLTINTENTNALTVTGAIQSGAHIVVESQNGLTINSTSEEPIDIVVEMNNTKTLSLKGNYNNIYVKGKGFSGSAATVINGAVTIEAAEGTSSVSFGGDWNGTDCAVYTEYEGNVNITNYNPTGDEKLTVYAPNATVTMNNAFDEVTVTVSPNTLILNPSFHARKLTVLNGNVVMNGIDINEFCDEIECEGTITSKTYDVLTASAGISNLNEDTEGNGLTFAITANGHARWNLNEHTYTMKRNMETGVVLMRGTAKLDVYGPGKLTSNGVKEHYCMWVAAEDNVLNIYGGDYEGYTHTLYAEKGVINVYGGTFKLLNADTADRDPNGLLKFLCNCYDASYTAGTAKINIYGGKFYEFNPAVSYSEPGGPVSFVAEGYGVVESEEDGKRVFTVLPVDQIPAETPVVEGDETPNQGE